MWIYVNVCVYVSICEYGGRGYVMWIMLYWSLSCLQEYLYIYTFIQFYIYWYVHSTRLIAFTSSNISTYICTYINRYFCTKATQALNRGPRPNFISIFEVCDVSFGSSPPTLCSLQVCMQATLQTLQTLDIWIYGYMALSLFCIIVISADQLLVVHWKTSPHLLIFLSSSITSYSSTSMTNSTTASY